MMGMKVNVRFFITLMTATNASATSVDIEEGGTFGDVVSALLNRYGEGLRQEIMEPGGSINRNLKLLVNGNFVDREAILKTPAVEGDTLYFCPPIIGG
jgi:MoaD family protein